MRSAILILILSLGFLANPSCTKKTETAESKGAVLSPEEVLASRGRKTYQSQCTQCHNRDFTKDGALGPAVAGSSRELLEARLLHASYPPGYKPKRNSNAMPAMPYLKSEIDALTAYLATTPSSK